MDPSLQALADQLIEFGYDGLFLSIDESDLDSIWSKPGGPDRLKELVRTSVLPWQARFLAAEICFARQPDFPPQEALPVLAEIYTTALAQTGVLTGDFYFPANRWGFLYEFDDPGEVGQHLVSLGEAAVPGLVSLLDNNDAVLYEGSREAVVGNEYQFRVKDIAAFYLGKIRHIPVKYYREPKKRNVEIKRLQQLLTTGRL